MKKKKVIILNKGKIDLPMLEQNLAVRDDYEIEGCADTDQEFKFLVQLHQPDIAILDGNPQVYTEILSVLAWLADYWPYVKPAVAFLHSERFILVDYINLKTSAISTSIKGVHDCILNVKDKGPRLSAF